MVLSTAYAHSQGTYDNLQTLGAAMMRIQRDLTRAKLILASSDNLVLYWAGDDNRDGEINLSELAAIRFDPELRQLDKHVVAFPETMDPDIREALDSRVTLAAAMDSSTILPMIENHSRHDVQRVAENIQSFTVKTRPQCPLATLVMVKLTAGDETQSATVHTAVAARAHRVRDIGISENQYVLVPRQGSIRNDVYDANGPP